MGALFRGPTWRGRTARPFYSLLHRILAIIFVLCIFQQQRLFFKYRDALLSKYSPTTFKTGHAHFRPKTTRDDEDESRLQGELLKNRQNWKLLGSGCEGMTFSFNGSVIKTFRTGGSPLRNCVPRQTNTKWPTEIPASLYFGDLITSASAPRDTNMTNAAFLPVQTYFMASTPSSATPEWHLVTPFLNEGNLVALAKKIRRSQKASSMTELDARYRPTFERFLGSLESMHRVGLCHDDIKPDNVFVRDDSQWILGDLGNVRHILHPYHYSRIWRDNEQHPDCRANDAIRALKSYIRFLRTASIDADTFDIEFLEQSEPLGRLFWEIGSNAREVSAKWLRTKSIQDVPSQLHSSTMSPGRAHAAELQTPRKMFATQRTSHSRMVDRALSTPLSDAKAKILGMTWLFGVPEISC